MGTMIIQSPSFSFLLHPSAVVELLPCKDPPPEAAVALLHEFGVALCKVCFHLSEEVALLQLLLSPPTAPPRLFVLRTQIRAKNADGCSNKMCVCARAFISTSTRNANTEKEKEGLDRQCADAAEEPQSKGNLQRSVNNRKETCLQLTLIFTVLQKFCSRRVCGCSGALACL